MSVYLTVAGILVATTMSVRPSPGYPVAHAGMILFSDPNGPEATRRSWVASAGVVNGVTGYVFPVDPSTRGGTFQLDYAFRVDFFSDMAEGRACGRFHQGIGRPCGTHGVITQPLAKGAQRFTYIPQPPPPPRPHQPKPPPGTPVPATQPPGTLSWQPPSGAVPMGRSYVYLNREPNLPCSAKSGLLLTLSDGVIDVRHDGRLINVSINWESWLYDQFKVPSGQFRPVVGAYNASGELWHDSASMLVGYHGRPGRFAIDAVTYGPEGWIDAVTMRFEQPCGYGVDPYRGKIHWNRLERPIFPTAPPAPSWQPPEKLPPPNVSALYLEHTPGRYGGPTGTSLEASADVTMQVRHWEGRIGFSAWDRAGSHWTHAEFVLPARFTKAFAGHFPDLRRAGGIHNPVKGGVDFGRHGSGCNTLEGWFAIDEISFYDDLVDSMTVRFEVDCGFVTRGKLQWKRAAYRSADEATLPFYPLGVPSLGAVS